MDDALRPGALSGVRIIDFSWALAGPFCTQMFAFLGAEVVKIESMKRLDLVRKIAQTYGRAATSDVDVDHSYEFNSINMNKLSVRLDLSRPEAVDIVQRLARVTDAVVENFSAGVLNRLGLGYPVLQRQNPSIVLASLSGSGSAGPESRFLGYAPIFGAVSGASHFAGYQDGPPAAFHTPGDVMNGTITAFALMSALVYRRQTGRGQFIDLSSREGLSVLVGDAIMEYTLNGRDRGRQGNRDVAMAPHNCYPCRNDDASGLATYEPWVTIAVRSDADWRVLCEAMGNPTWTEEDRFSTTLGRWRDQEELDRRVAEWTKTLSPTEVTHLLQTKGIPAFPCMSPKDIYADPHLAERGAFQTVEHPRLGTASVLSPPWKFSKTPARIVRHGPLMGEHVNYVLGDVLGITSSEIGRLVIDKVIY